MRKWIVVAGIAVALAGLTWGMAAGRQDAGSDPEGAQEFDRELARGVRQYTPPPEAADGERMEQARRQMETAYQGRK